MGIKIVWDSSGHRILRQVMDGEWTADEYRHISERTEKLLRGLKHVVHIIIDAQDSTRTPSNLLAVMRQVDKHKPANLGEVVVVGADDVLYTMLEASRRIAPHLMARMRFVDSLQDAYAVITAADTTVHVDDMLDDMTSQT